MHQNLIRLGDDSYNVTRLKTFLNSAIKSQQLEMHPVFDKNTERLVKHYQGTMRLSSDGVVGPKTLAVMKLDLTPTYLTDEDYDRAARALRIETAIIRAVAEVETKTEAFWVKQNYKTPILFERHVFDRLFLKAWKSGQTLADLTTWREKIRKSDPDICHPHAGGYGSYKDQYPKLEKAAKISDTLACSSASWGTFQIMGYHATNIGYHSVQAFARAMQASQMDHLEAFMRFVRSDQSLLRAMRTKQWGTFARAYNGPSQKGYDEKLQAAYLRLKHGT